MLSRFRGSMLVVCLMALTATTVHSQKPDIEPLRVAQGTILPFHLQTRLNSNSGALDNLPRGTVLAVRVLDSIDSDVNRDGTEFRGTIVSAIASGNEIVVHSEAEVRGLLVLLRSKSHPDGFRYELLITGLTDHGKTFEITASLNPSISDASNQHDPGSTETKEKTRANVPSTIPTHP
jgi:hypothetical protein